MTINRELIEHCVSQNPGIGFTELKQELDLSNGVLQHHLERSENILNRKGGYVPKGKCSQCKFSSVCSSRCILNITRKEYSQEILRGKFEGVKQSEIADILNLDDSTVSYHVEKLRDYGLLDENDNLTIEYRKFEACTN